MRTARNRVHFVGGLSHYGAYELEVFDGVESIYLISLGSTVLALFYLRRKKRKQMKTIITSGIMIKLIGSKNISKTPLLYIK